jgi:hypothetical protein
LDEVLYCYVEKVYFREYGYFDSLEEWRNERSFSIQLMDNIEKQLKKEVLYCYKSSKDDPEVARIPKEPQFEAWKSFSIVVREINFYGFGSEQAWLNCVEEVGERFYEEYLVMHEKLIKGTGKDDYAMCSPQDHCWRNSGARYNLHKEMKYRGWCEDFITLCEEVCKI